MEPLNSVSDGSWFFYEPGKDMNRMNFASAVQPPSAGNGPALWFVFRGNDLLVSQEGDSATVPLLSDPAELNLKPVRRQYLGLWEGRDCYSAELENGAVAPEGMDFRGLRRLFGLLDQDLFQLAGRAVQIVDWDRSHQFCGKCGVPTQSKSDERARICPQCGLLSFPRISPAVIVAVVKDDRLLLAHANHFPAGMYSVLAGFVEPGETLEECVRREVGEEVGVEVANIRYFGSQSWPFPHSLMIGFTAEYAGGTLTIDGNEIAAADWFTADDLPRIPDKISIARRLIDWFVENGR
jgi:NAD+ diphosphatase